MTGFPITALRETQSRAGASLWGPVTPDPLFFLDNQSGCLDLSWTSADIRPKCWINTKYAILSVFVDRSANPRVAATKLANLER